MGDSRRTVHISVTNFFFCSLLLEHVCKDLCQHVKVDEDLCYQLGDLQKVLFVSSREKKRIKMAIFYLLPIGRRDTMAPNLQIVFSIVPKMMSWFIEFVKLTRILLLFNVAQFHTPHCDVSLQRSYSVLQ